MPVAPNFCLNATNNGFVNCSGMIGQAIEQASTYTTGSIFLTLLFVVLALLAIAMMLKIEIEYTMIIILPLTLALMSHFQEFVAIGSVILIYLSILITKHFMLK